MTGPEFRQLCIDLGEAIGRPLTLADVAKLCSLPAADGLETVRRWEIKGLPAGPVAERLRILAMASERYPILDKFNVFDRHDVALKDRPALRAEFRRKLCVEVLERLD
ncbi:hypothetical protein ES707_08885 [subsurface metagenome]